MAGNVRYWPNMSFSRDLSLMIRVDKPMMEMGIRRRRQAEYF